VIDKGYTHPQAADSLGVSLSALGRWVRAERGGAGGGGQKTALNLADQNELARPLRKTNGFEWSAKY
jgi:transposase